MLSDDGLEILVSATSLVTYVGLCLKNGEIQVNTLRIVQKSRARFLELYSLISKEAAVTRKVNEDQGSQQEVGSMEIFLDLRIEELKSFENEREAVFTFIEMCSVIKTGESCIIALSMLNLLRGLKKMSYQRKYQFYL